MVAPAWHTALLIGSMLAVAIAGVVLMRRGAMPSAAGSRVTAVYLPAIVVEWGLALYACRASRAVLRDLVGRRPALVDAALAIAAFVAIEACEHAFASGAHAAVLPRAADERIAWVFVAASAAPCEEIVYRGYVQRQLAALTGRAWIAVFLQALLFGLAHLDRGAAVAARVAAYGALFGVLALGRRSLWPGIGAHFAVDLVGAFA